MNINSPIFGVSGDGFFELFSLFFMYCDISCVIFLSYSSDSCGAKYVFSMGVLKSMSSFEKFSCRSGI